MCEQCSAKTKVYGQVVENWFLVRATQDGNMMKAGDWGLVDCNDPTWVWPGDLVPLKNPLFGMTEEEENAIEIDSELWKADDKFWEFIEEFEKYFKCDYPTDGYYLVKSAKQSGWDQKIHGYSFVAWLSHRMAVLIEEAGEKDLPYDIMWEEGSIQGSGI